VAPRFLVPSDEIVRDEETDSPLHEIDGIVVYSVQEEPRGKVSPIEAYATRRSLPVLRAKAMVGSIHQRSRSSPRSRTLTLDARAAVFAAARCGTPAEAAPGLVSRRQQGVRLSPTARSLSSRCRLARRNCFGDEALVRCRAIARVAVSFPWRSTHADVSYQRNTSMSGPSASQKRANRAGR